MRAARAPPGRWGSGTCGVSVRGARHERLSLLVFWFFGKWVYIVGFIFLFAALLPAQRSTAVATGSIPSFRVHLEFFRSSTSFFWRFLLLTMAQAASADAGPCSCGKIAAFFLAFPSLARIVKFGEAGYPYDEDKGPEGVCFKGKPILAHTDALSTAGAVSDGAAPPAHDPPPSSPSASIVFEKDAKAAFETSPGFTPAGSTEVIPGSRGFQYVRNIDFSTAFRPDAVVGTLKSFGFPSHSNRKDLEKKYPSLFDVFKKNVKATEVCAFLNHSDPYVVYRAVEAAQGLLREAFALKEILDAKPKADGEAGGAADLASRDNLSEGSRKRLMEMFDNIVAQVSALTLAVFSLSGGPALAEVFKRYKDERARVQQIPLMAAAENPGDAPVIMADSFLWPFLARMLNTSMPYAQGRVLEDGRDAAEVLTHVPKISMVAGVFTDFESLKPQASFWGHMGKRSDTWKALEEAWIRTVVFEQLDEIYIEKISKGENFLMYKAHVQFKSVARAPRARDPPTEMVTCAEDGCSTRFLPMLDGHAFCRACAAAHSQAKRRRLGAPASAAVGKQPAGPSSARRDSDQ